MSSENSSKSSPSSSTIRSNSNSKLPMSPRRSRAPSVNKEKFIEKYEDVQKSDNLVIDVSRLTDDFRGWVTTKQPLTHRGGRKWFEGFKIISDNYNSYKQAANALGEKYEKYVDMYAETYTNTYAAIRSPRRSSITSPEKSLASPKTLSSPKKSLASPKKSLSSPKKSSTTSDNPKITNKSKTATKHTAITPKSTIKKSTTKPSTKKPAADATTKIRPSRKPRKAAGEEPPMSPLDIIYKNMNNNKDHTPSLNKVVVAASSSDNDIPQSSIIPFVPAPKQ